MRLASGLSRRCVEKQCGVAGLCFGGRTALDLRLSRVCTGVAAMGQDCNYHLDTTELGRKKTIIESSIDSISHLIRMQHIWLS